MTRKLIAALQVSLDGFIQPANGDDAGWVDSWADAIALIPDVDTFVLGAGMYPDYGEYWRAIHDDPTRVGPFASRLPNDREIAYARLAAKSPHLVVSRTLAGVAWPATARIVRDLEELRAVRGQPGKNVYVLGGPTLVGSLLNAGLIDELRLIVHPLILGGGKALFAGVGQRRALTFVRAEPGKLGTVILAYRT